MGYQSIQEKIQSINPSSSRKGDPPGKYLLVRYNACMSNGHLIMPERAKYIAELEIDESPVLGLRLVEVEVKLLNFGLMHRDLPDRSAIRDGLRIFLSFPRAHYGQPPY